MQKIKNKFTFQVSKVTCYVESIDGKWYAVTPNKKVELNIELHDEDKMHKGRISRASDNKYIAWLPSTALEEAADPMEILKQISELLKTIGL